MTDKLTAAELEEGGLIAIIRAKGDVDLARVAQALAEGGIRAMEITLNTPGALPAVAVIRKALGPALRVGSGTILGPDDAQAAMDAGAEFIVTPTLQLDTIALCRQRGVPIVCGCMTPTECLAAYRAGADFLKLFPADTLGPAYVRALRAPMPFLKFIPTGGVSLDTLPAWMEAGCAGVALGSNLVSAAVLRDKDWDALTSTARQYVKLLAESRANL